MRTLGQNQFPRLEPPGIARIAILGEAWGQREQETGLPFQGPSGALLNAALSQVGIVRDQCFVGNVVNLRPAGNDFNTLDWNSEEVQSSIAQLREDLIKFKPSIILCLGNAALFLMKRGANPGPRKTRQKRKQEGGEDDTELSAPEHGAQGEPATEGLGILTSHETLQSGSFLWPDKIGSWRGSLFESEFLSCSACLDWSGELRMTCPECEGRGFKVKCLATFHPAAVLRDFSLQPLFRLDLKRLAEESKTRELVLPARNISIAAPSTHEMYEVLKDIDRLRHREKRLSFDLEGHCGNVTCLGFATDASKALVIPLAHANGESVWPEDLEVQIMEAVKAVLEDPSIEKIMQNGLYDAFVLAWTYGIVIRNFAFDTMVGMWECFAELPKGLATQASILTKEPFYKPDKGEEGEMKFASDEEFWRYNGIDACVTLECHEAQMKLMNEGQKAHYAFNMQLMPALLFMEIRGMKWASDEASIAREEALRKAYEMQARIDLEAVAKSNKEDFEKSQELHDLLCLVNFGTLIPNGLDCEGEMARLVASRLCQKSIKRPVEVVERRWQPMKWNGKKWVKVKGMLTDISGFVPGPTDDAPPLDHIWLKPMPRTLLKNLPFFPSTLAECEDFILESKKGEWARVKEIWKELNHETNYKANQDHFERAGVCENICGNRIEQLREASQAIRSNAALLGELSTLLSLAINVGSTQADGDAQRFLYEICQLPEQHKRAKGKKSAQVSTDQNALVALYAKTSDPRVLWVLQLRRLRKLASDLATEVDDDGRIRSTFSLVKETGRMSASESPTSKGTNLQAWNAFLRYIIKADEGCVMRQRDLRGADSWSVACECAALGDPTMLDDLKAGMRPAEILGLIVRRGISVNSLDRAALQKEIDADKASWPFWLYPGNKAGIHLTSYEGKVPTLIQTLLRNSLKELPLNLEEAQPIVLTKSQGEAIQNAVFTRYPGLKKWHQKAEQNLLREGSIKTSAGHVRKFFGRKKEFRNGQWIANSDTKREYLSSLPQFITTLATKLALHRLWYDHENNSSSENQAGFLRCEPLFVVHDSALLQCKKEDEAWCIEKEKEWFGSEVEVAGIKIVIPASTERGEDWGMGKRKK